MFEIPTGKENLMNEYKALVIQRIKTEKKKPFVTHEDILENMPAMTTCEVLESLANLTPDIYLEEYSEEDDMETLKSFVEDKVGEDFIIFEGLENKVFCLHSVEDYVKDYLFSNKEDCELSQAA